MDARLLSKYKKKFKVFSHSGAEIKDIAQDVLRVQQNGVVDVAIVTSVFLICGGNDIRLIKIKIDYD